MAYRPTARPSGNRHDGGACWSCGGTTPQAPGSGYCHECITRGDNQPFISCLICGDLKRRQFRGQHHFTCTKHKKEKP